LRHGASGGHPESDRRRSPSASPTQRIVRPVVSRNWLKSSALQASISRDALCRARSWQKIAPAQLESCHRCSSQRNLGLAAALRGSALRADTACTGPYDLRASAMGAAHSHIHVLQSRADTVSMQLCDGISVRNRPGCTF
jgi:hypothetical protein